MVSGGVVGIAAPVERVIAPAKPFRLDRVIVVVPEDPEAKESVIGLTVKPKSLTTTFSLTVLERVSGLLRASAVAYVPDTITK
jgi:hypothetical protein